MTPKQSIQDLSSRLVRDAYTASILRSGTSFRVEEEKPQAVIDIQGTWHLSGFVQGPERVYALSKSTPYDHLDNEIRHKLESIYRDIYVMSTPGLDDDVVTTGALPFMAMLEIDSIRTFIELPTDTLTFDGLKELHSSNLHHGHAIATIYIRHRDRLVEFVQSHGWEYFAIVSASQTFREASRNMDEPRWDLLKASLKENRRSLDMFAQLHGLPSESFLTDVKKLPEYDQWEDVGSPIIVPYHANPMEYYLPLKGNATRNRHPESNKTQRDILSMRYSKAWSSSRVTKPSNWPKRIPREALEKEDWEFPPKDITNLLSRRIVSDKWRVCDLCGKIGCTCGPDDYARPLLELREYPECGRGVRTLQAISENAYLDEYLGEFIPRDAEYDPIYAFEVDRPFPYASEEAQRRGRQGDLQVGQVLAKDFGNWTRYVNHSCNPNCYFDTKLVGERFRNMLIAKRNIAPFEQLTAHYGDNYWQERVCNCGEENCVSRRS